MLLKLKVEKTRARWENLINTSIGKLKIDVNKLNSGRKTFTGAINE